MGRSGASVEPTSPAALRNAPLNGTTSGVRWGGEEFVVLAPGLSATAIRELAERLRCVIGDEPSPSTSAAASRSPPAPAAAAISAVNSSARASPEAVGSGSATSQARSSRTACDASSCLHAKRRTGASQLLRRSLLEGEAIPGPQAVDPQRTFARAAPIEEEHVPIDAGGVERPRRQAEQRVNVARGCVRSDQPSHRLLSAAKAG